ncbi:hypothetical protein CONCODRAFT_78192 [Conidiobolus coronatus NRRL 28638]|uniref:Uncharacterized protein n=1 Tax=Conidiobolus coronatus (strain ATCC 28846 / CBS 209.66 / NRRL 28638) TaxID=796925 RepID=A0A137P9J9_CONC2|nr:hypothetical protein CONCODRAFT_78192 [Conidiobolus coronatus NRRL 28638]|eukprot:KXN71688.1 hypothetical protein CONCODRAFT_78192 [Conidiobolus coronatus NRRL 28638]
MESTTNSTIIHLKMRDEEDMGNWLAQAQKYLNSSNSHRQAHRDSISVNHRSSKLHCVSQTSIPQFTPSHKHSYSADSVESIPASFVPESTHIKKSSSILPKRIKFPSMSSFRSFSSSSSSSSASSSSPLDAFDEDLVHRLPFGEYLDDDELSLMDLDFEPITPKQQPDQAAHGRSRSLSKVFQSMTNLKSK